MLIIHHTRKPKEATEDPLDSVSGTRGLGGAADAILVLKKAAGADDATLHVTGRDVEERDVGLLWDAARCEWQASESGGMTEEQRRVVEMLKANGPMTAIEAASKLGKGYQAARRLLCRMAAAGKLRPTKGRYALVEA